MTMGTRVSTKRIALSLTEIVACLYFSISSISKLGQMIGVPREVFYGFFFACYALYIIQQISKIRIIDFIYYVFAIAVVSYGVTHYGSYITQRVNLLAIFVIFLPAYHFFRFTNNDALVKGLRFGVYIDVVYLFLLYTTTILRSGRYSMEYAYEACIPLCFFIYMYIQTKRKAYLFAVGVLSLTIIVSGNRGAVLFPLICTLYYYVSSKSYQTNRNKRTIALLVISTLIIGALIFGDGIVTILSKLFPNSRSISKLVTGTFFTSESRARLYEICRGLIENNKTGYGPLASRMLIQGMWYIYPHSLYYELQLDFGLYIGIILFVILMAIAVMNLIHYKDDSVKVLVGIICIVGIGKLMVSSSYYIEMYIPATIAFFAKYKITRKEN